MERKFTKEHNELDWLFPEIPNAYISSGEAAFNQFEKYAESLFKNAHGDQETFTKADIIDAFMKGASIAQQIIGFGAFQKEEINKPLHSYIEETYHVGKEPMWKVGDILAYYEFSTDHEGENVLGEVAKIELDDYQGDWIYTFEDGGVEDEETLIRQEAYKKNKK